MWTVARKQKYNKINGHSPQKEKNTLGRNCCNQQKQVTASVLWLCQKLSRWVTEGDKWKKIKAITQPLEQTITYGKRECFHIHGNEQHMQSVHVTCRGAAGDFS